MSETKPQAGQCLLKFQIGPVQDFIAQARSTRDLWSGSYLLSWLVAHAIEALLASSNQVQIVYPHVSSGDDFKQKLQPLVRYLRDKGPPAGNSGDAWLESVLLPNLPSVVLAVVPGHWMEREVEKHALEPIQKEWEGEIEACLEYYQQRCPFSPEECDLFRVQARRFWQISWQLWPIHGRQELLTLLSDWPGGPGSLQVHAGTPEDSLWLAHTQLVSHRLEARRRTRDFTPWPVTPLATRDKDALSGREEAVANKAWLQRAQEHEELRYRFRNGDQLGAPNLIKRVWDLARLKPLGLPRKRITYDSVPSVAAAPWLNRLLEATSRPDVEQAFWEFVAQASEAQNLIPVNVPELLNARPADWLKGVDGMLFHAYSWQQWMTQGFGDASSEVGNRAKLQAALTALEKLSELAGIGKPGSYVAILALDGDEMGRWLGGERHTESSPLSRKWHEKFSEALADFAFNHVRKEVEAHFGQLIYAGGDDVLAMLPAEEAIPCAVDLAKHFRSVVGKAASGVTASVGIAIGHLKEPLQDMVKAAQDSEKIAKKATDKGGWGRNALAVTLFKRSGETVVWGAKFQPGLAFALLQDFRPSYRPLPGKSAADMPISAGFPHRIIAALAKFGPEAPFTEVLKDIAAAEIGWIVRRQTHKGLNIKSDAELKTLRQTLNDRSGQYLEELCAGKRPLQEFYNLFAVEAFIAQSKD